MPNIVYEVVEHDGGWAYKVGDVFSERFETHDQARQAADKAAARHELADETEVISYQDEKGDVHVEVAAGEDRPEADVEDEEPRSESDRRRTSEGLPSHISR